MGFLRGMMMFGRNLEWNSCLRNSCGEGLDLDKMIELSMEREIVCTCFVFKWFIYHTGFVCVGFFSN